MERPEPRDTERFTAAEELAHSLTHGAGLVLGVFALVLLILFAVRKGTPIHVISCTVYGSTLVLMYASSTLYHALPVGRGKRVFEVLDHASIFLLIAGTYTPFVLVTLEGGLGWSLFAAIWTLALAGVLLEAVSRERLRRLKLLLYLLMGWGIVGAARPLVRELPPGGLFLLLAGGLFYTFGVVFYVWRRPFHHMVWHLFVLAGSICHFLAVFLYVIP